MNKLFIRLFGFGAFTVMVWGLIFLACSQSFTMEYRLIAQESNWGYVNQRSSEWATKSDHTEDVLFFGPSTCYSGIDPSSLSAYGLQGFNFCSSAQKMGNALELIKAALGVATPKFIVLDVYPKIWGTGHVGFESSKDWIINSNLREENWSRAYRAMAWESKDLFTLLQTVYYDAVRPFVKAGSNSNLVEDKNGIYRGLGWVERTFPVIDSVYCETERVEMTEFECKAVESIQAICDTRDIQLILLNPPQLCEEEFELPECFEGLIYIDGNHWPGAKVPQFYYDDHHLVGAGARGYSDWLANIIFKLN